MEKGWESVGKKSNFQGEALLMKEVDGAFEEGINVLKECVVNKFLFIFWC